MKHTKKFNNSFIFALVIIIGFFFFSVAAIYYFVKPKDTVTPPAVIQTSQWKTYTNDNHGFIFKYPPAWSIKDQNTSFVSMWSAEHKKSGKNVSDFSINFCGTAPECLAKLNQNNGTSAKTIKEFIAARYPSYKEVVIDGHKAYEWVSTPSTYNLYVILENGIYVVSTPFEKNSINPIAKEMINTVNF